MADLTTRIVFVVIVKDDCYSVHSATKGSK